MLCLLLAERLRAYTRRDTWLILPVVCRPVRDGEQSWVNVAHGLCVGCEKKAELFRFVRTVDCGIDAHSGFDGELGLDLELSVDDSAL